jgi:hypothetical protein
MEYGTDQHTIEPSFGRWCPAVKDGEGPRSERQMLARD